MRVTLVSPFDPFPDGDGDAHLGGVERVYAEVAPRLADRDHQVTLVTSTDGDPERDHHGGVDVIRRPRAGTVLGTPVARIWDSIPDSDVVQVPATYPSVTPAVVRRAEKDDASTVLDFHFEPHPPSLLGRAAARLYARLGPRLYSRADRVLVRSERYADETPSLAHVSPRRVRVVPNGIDPERFTPAGPAWGGEYALFVGRLVPYKGLDVLLEALSRAEADLPLVVAGEGPLRDDLEAQAEELGVDATFLGYVPDDGLPALYRGATVTVLPSVNRQEAFGITLLESMACGTPVVASSLPGVRGVASHGGLVAPPGEPGVLAGRLEAAVGTTMPRGPALARRVHDRFDWETVVDRTEAVYRELNYPTSASEAGPAKPEVAVA